MRRTTFLSAAFAAALAAGVAVRAEAPAADAGPLRLMALSADLYARGVAASDALFVLEAARLRRAAGLDAGPDAGAQDGGPQNGAALTGADEMFASARALAAGDPALLGLIADAEAEALKGVLIGPTYLNASFASKDEPAVMTFDYKGGLLAEVYVEGRPGTNIDIQVRDDEGNLVCADTHPSHVAYCDWIPARDGTFTIIVLNRSGDDPDFVLITN